VKKVSMNLQNEEIILVLKCRLTDIVLILLFFNVNWQTTHNIPTSLKILGKVTLVLNISVLV
jgi:hypothetical protein